MKKTNKLWIILDLIFLIIFNAVYFVAGGLGHGASAWVSYVFIHIAYLLLIITPKLVRSGKSAAVFGFALYSLSSVYFLIELVIGSVFILINPNNVKIALLVQLCLAGLYAAALVSNMIANEHTADLEEERQTQNAYVKNASSKLRSLLERIDDEQARKKVEKVYDVLHSSPVKSHTSLASAESQISEVINELETAVAAKDYERLITLADSLLLQVNERNLRLKTLN